MASKRRQRRKACEGKVPYPTQDDAVQAAGRAQRTRGTALNAYRCRFCGAWHLGHLNKRITRQIHERRNSR